MEVRLDKFDNSTFDKNGGVFKRALWLIVNGFLFQAKWFPFMKIKRWLLILFGAKIGSGLVIKPGVNIKFPWKLAIGDNVWLGEDCWIDNLDYVSIGNNVCISQGALLLTGNHDYKSTSFDYMNAPIMINDGVWIGAKGVVCPGVSCETNSILTVGSVATKCLEESSIYQGCPALFLRKRSLVR